MVNSGAVNGNNQPIVAGGVAYSNYFRFVWSLDSQSVTNNTSTISWDVGWYFVSSDRALSDGDLSIDGTSVWDDSGGLHSFTSNFQTRFEIIESGTTTINHDNDGTKSFDVSGSILGFNNKRSSGEGSFTLPTIARVSLPTLSNDNPDSNDIITLTTNRADDNFVHRLTLVFTPQVGNPYTVNLNQNIATSINLNMANYKTTIGNRIPNDMSISAEAKLKTYNGSVSNANLIGEEIVEFTYNLVGVEPTFTTYATTDRNSTTSSVTGDNTKFIQGKSLPRTRITSGNKMVARFGASADRYQSLIAGHLVSRDYSANSINIDHTAIESMVDVTQVVTAIDSRNSQTEVSKELTVIPYASPVLNISASRANGFDSNITIESSGSFSGIRVGGVNRNTLFSTAIQYRTKIEGGSFSNWTTIARTVSGTNVSGADTGIVVDSDKFVDIEVRFRDRLETTTESVRVSAGVPILFIDSTGKLGINKIPDGTTKGLYLKDQDNLFKSIYPIGSIIKTNTNTNPSGKFGGTWSAYNTDRLDRFMTGFYQQTQANGVILNGTETYETLLSPAQFSIPSNWVSGTMIVTASAQAKWEGDQVTGVSTKQHVYLTIRDDGGSNPAGIGNRIIIELRDEPTSSGGNLLLNTGYKKAVVGGNNFNFRVIGERFLTQHHVNFDYAVLEIKAYGRIGYLWRRTA